MNYQVIQGDCREILQTIPDASVDAIISDPPYPEIDRDYGRVTEIDWMEMMQDVVRQSKRVLKPSGSAVFILQPNSEKVGKMRLWLWKFMVWAGEDWNIVQDAYWWNYTALPTVGCSRDHGMMRPSVKACIWLGDASCYRMQENVLWDVSESVRKSISRSVDKTVYTPSGAHINRKRAAQTAVDRGGSTPYNLIPVSTANSRTESGSYGHGAGTPLKLADWWIR